jgi:hypothetical protein
MEAVLSFASSASSEACTEGVLVRLKLLTLLSRREVVVDGRLAVRFGGVSVVFSAVFWAEEAVGRIMRARNPSSTLLSLVTGRCGSFFLGGGPMLGLGFLETGAFGYLLPPVVVLALLDARARVLPDCAVRDWREVLPLAPDAAV